MKSTDRLGIIIILLIVLACQLSLLQKASVWMESGLRSAIQKEVLIFIAVSYTHLTLPTT